MLTFNLLYVNIDMLKLLVCSEVKYHSFLIKPYIIRLNVCVCVSVHSWSCPGTNWCVAEGENQEWKTAGLTAVAKVGTTVSKV